MEIKLFINVENDPTNDFYYYSEFFKTTNEFVIDILNNSDHIYDLLYLYWDGIGMKLTEVQRMYQTYSLDQQQNAYDCH